MGRPLSAHLLPPVALCITLALTSCSAGGSDVPDGAPATRDGDVIAATSPAAPKSPTPTDSPTSPASPPSPQQPATGPGAEPTSDDEVSTYTTADGSLSFDHPSDWSVTPVAEASATSVIVATSDGRQVATLETGLITGAVCPAELPYALLDSEPLPALTQGAEVPRFAFEQRTDPSITDPVRQTTLAYGITAAPEPTGPDACPIAHFFTWPPSGAAFGGTYDPFAVHPGKPMHVDTPQAYMETEEYQDIRSMITSLRPAG